MRKWLSNLTDWQIRRILDIMAIICGLIICVIEYYVYT